MSDGNVNNGVGCISVATQSAFSHSLFVSFWMTLPFYSVQVQTSFWALESILDFSLCRIVIPAHPPPPAPPPLLLRPRVSFSCCQSLGLWCRSLPLPFCCRLSWINAALAAVTFQLRSHPPASTSRISAGFSHCHIVAQVLFYWSCQGADLSMSRGRKRDASRYDGGERAMTKPLINIIYQRGGGWRVWFAARNTAPSFVSSCHSPLFVFVSSHRAYSAPEHEYSVLEYSCFRYRKKSESLHIITKLHRF